MRSIKVVRDPKAFDLLADETRRKMIYFLRAREASVNQLSQELAKTPQAIYHHVRKLLDSGLIEVAREERIGHLVEAYYRATAEVFQFSHGEGGGKHEEKRVAEALQALAKLGLPLRIDEEITAKIVRAFRKIDALGDKPELEEKIEAMDDLDFLAKREVSDFAKFLSMTEKQFEEYVANFKELRSILKSRLNQASSADKPRKVPAS